MTEIISRQFKGEQKINILTQTEFFTSSRLALLIQTYANFAAEHYASENTKVYQTLGVPSLVVRVDTTVTDPYFISGGNGQFQLNGSGIKPYELEERPAGLGVMSVVNPKFGQHLKSYLQPGERTFAVISPERQLRNNYDDDHLPGFVQSEKEATRIVTQNGGQILARDMKGNRLSGLAPHSISTIDTEGDKTYQPKVDSEITTNGSNIATGQAFVSQPIADTSKGYGLKFYLPNVSPSQIIESDQKYLVTDPRKAAQLMRDKKTNIKPFYPPIPINQISRETNLPEIERYAGIIRMYLIYNILNRSYQIIGGAFMARPNNSLLIHGTNDAITIPIN